MAEQKLMEEKSPKIRREMRVAACNYFRNSGRSCRECRCCGTKQCIYAGNTINEELLKKTS